MENKYELTRFILSSDIRLNLILLLYEDYDHTDDFSSKLDKTPGNILRALNELISKNLVVKVERSYKLTPVGYLIALNINHLFDTWYSLENNSRFWQSHDINLIDPYFLNKIHIWKNAKLIEYTKTDVTRTFTSYAGNISNATEMNIILPIYSSIYVDLILKFCQKNKAKLKLVTNENILKLIREKDDGLFDELIKNRQLELILIDKPLKLFWSVCDNFVSLFLFLDEESFDDSEMLLVKDKSVFNDAISAFNMYVSLLRQ